MRIIFIMRFKKILLLVLLSLALLCFVFAGRFLVVSQKPIHSDAIIVLGGGRGERTLKASHLYKQGFADVVINSNGGTRFHRSTKQAMIQINWLINDGVPRKAILAELKSQSTYGNAFYTKKMMKKYHFTSAIVISSAYHMRRAQYIFNKVYHGSGIQLDYVAAPVPHFYPSFWWATLTGWYQTISEYIKLIIYLIIYGIF